MRSLRSTHTRRGFSLRLGFNMMFRNFSFIVALCSIFAVPFSGCVVNTNSRGTILVHWDVPSGASCSSMGIASVQTIVTRGGSSYGTFTSGFCQDYEQTVQVGEGGYVLQVQGVNAAGTVVAVSPSQSIFVYAGTVVDAAVVLLSPVNGGNVIPTGSSSITATWTLGGQAPSSGCAATGVQTVVMSVVDQSNRVVGLAQTACGIGSATVSGLSAGVYSVQLDGYRPGDVQGSPSWGNAQLTSPQTLNANTDQTFQNPINMVALKTTSTGTGSLTVDWTVQGQPAAKGCAALSINQVTVTLLGADKNAQLLAQTVDCKAGQLQLTGVPAGVNYLQIDEANPPDNHAYGNVNLLGVNVVADQSNVLPAPLDVNARTIVAIPVGFAKGGTCAAHGVDSVRFRVSANGKLIVPFTDKDAMKPCELVGASYTQRVIDLQNSPPACAVPSNVQGLILCNAAGVSTLMVEGQGLSNQAITFGAKMEVTGLTDGLLTVVKTPMALQACSASDPLCQP